MSTKAKIAKILMVAALSAFALQTAEAQGEKPKAAGVKSKTAGAADIKGATSQADVAKTLKAAADALGMARWSGVGGGKLPEVDVVNRM